MPLVSARGITKRFGAATVLQNVDIDLPAAKAHALVGQNGAGKSTLLSILSALMRPDAGELTIGGQRIQRFGPRISRSSGVAMIHQELTVLPGLSALQNVFLGRENEEGARGLAGKGRQLERYEELAADLGVRISPDTKADELNIADRQSLEIMRGVAAGARVLLLDEPTATLGPQARDRVFETLGRLRSEGMCIVLVSHYLDELLDFCDDITVLRDGRVVESRKASAWSKDTLINAMVPPSAAREGEGGTTVRAHRGIQATGAVLSVEGMVVPGSAVKDGNRLEVRVGEIVGLAGLVGAGRTTLLQAIFGARAKTRGVMNVSGHDVRWPRSPREALALGFAYIDEDRKERGLWLDAPISDNLVVGDVAAISQFGVLLPRLRQRKFEELRETAGIAGARSAQMSVGQLSGGNQQKVMLARALQRSPKLLLADEPTRGVDVRARAEIWDTIHEHVADGSGVLVVSSDFEELFENCDRILVLTEGRIVHELTPEGFGMEAVLEYAFAN